MSDTHDPLVKIEDTKEFRLVVVSEDRRAASLLFPTTHERLHRFRDVTSISNASELFDLYVSNKSKKFVIFVDIRAEESLRELKTMIYGTQAETRGLLFAFTFEKLTDAEFERLISIGFDDAFELQRDDERQYLRMYSWIRRFGGTSISSENAERDAIARLVNKKNKRIGKWIIVGSDMAARDDNGNRVELTRQEVDFLALLSQQPDLVQSTSYDKLFKAPHAIVHKLKKKLGSDLPIQHDGKGRYFLLEDKG